MIRIHQLALPVEHQPEAMEKKAAKLLSVKPEEIKKLTIVRRSIDARKKDHLLYSYIVDVSLSSAAKERQAVKKAKSGNIQMETKKPYAYPAHGTLPLKHRPVIVGAGPAGLFAALALAENGYGPLLLEQGDPVEERVKKVERFWKEGHKALDPYSNVQFGEGGAGTFSDGKLNTMVKDTTGRNTKVLEIFAEAGAGAEILFDQKPHIGTDVLRTVVKRIRERILSAGGEISFRTEATELLLEDGRVLGVKARKIEEDGSFGEESVILADQVILALGHSSRKFFETLHRQGVPMEPKAFAVGLRVQHPQASINEAQYGKSDAGKLGAAPYKLTAKTSAGRGVYSFCMCPGGLVVNASSEVGGLCVNGMSNEKRDSKNANSAIIVTVTPEDFPETGPLGGIKFQRKLEETAYGLGGGNIPVQLYGDFKEGAVSKEFGGVKPQFCGETAFADLSPLLPGELRQAFLEGMEQFGKKIEGFDRPDAILAGVESRTSSPLTILRGDDMESPIKGLFPCGEGAGYAGGITSAAMDGLKAAEELIRRFAPF